MNTVQTEDLPEVETTEVATEEFEILESPEVETEESAEAEVEVEVEKEAAEEEPHKQSRSQNAKQRLRRKNQDLEAERLRLLEQARVQEERLATLEGKLEGVINPPAARPSRVDFDSEESYEDSLLDWKLDQTKAPVVKQEAPQAPQGRPQLNVDQKIHENWMNQLDDMSDKYDDFEEVISSIPDKSLTDTMTLALMESKQAGEVANFLGRNHAEATRISRLSLAAQVREIDKLGSKFKNTTSAPDPITPVHHKGDVKNEKVDPLLAGVTFE